MGIMEKNMETTLEPRIVLVACALCRILNPWPAPASISDPGAYADKITQCRAPRWNICWVLVLVIREV